MIHEEERGSGLGLTPIRGHYPSQAILPEHVAIGSLQGTVTSTLLISPTKPKSI